MFVSLASCFAMAESDPSTHSGSDIDLNSEGGLEASPIRRSDSKSHKRLGSVRALAIKKVCFA